MNALKELTEQTQMYKAIRYPSVPAFALPKSKFKDNTANNLTKAIISLITLRGGFASRVSTQGQFDPRLKAWRPGSVKKGMPDIVAIYKGLNLSIEVKIGKDRMSENQLKIKSQIESAGGRYFVARDFESFCEWFNKL